MPACVVLKTSDEIWMIMLQLLNHQVNFERPAIRFLFFLNPAFFLVSSFLFVFHLMMGGCEKLWLEYRRRH